MSWWQLKSIRDEIASAYTEEALRRLVDCPVDGTALRLGLRGQLYCPWGCGWVEQ